MGDQSAAPSKDEGADKNSLPADLLQVSESSTRLTARVESYAKELSESESRARTAELAARESELEALEIARRAVAGAKSSEAEAEKANAAAATAEPGGATIEVQGEALASHATQVLEELVAVRDGRVGPGSERPIGDAEPIEVFPEEPVPAAKQHLSERRTMDRKAAPDPQARQHQLIRLLTVEVCHLEILKCT